MRTIEKMMCAAVNGRKSWMLSNTSVSINRENGEVRVYLHGNCIYRKNNEGEFINLCGWNTNTTRSRLRALGIDICTKNYTPYLNGVAVSCNGWHAA